MIEINKDDLTSTREGYLFVYLQMTFNQLRRYANLEQVGKKGVGWRKYTARFELEAEFLECKILGVLAAALFLEAYIFDYCARKTSPSYTKKYLDKMDPVSKWVICTKLFAPPGISAGKDIIGRINKLNSLRNSLVHHKLGASTTTPPPPFPDDFLPNKCLNLIIDVLSELLAIDPNEEFASFCLRHIDSWFKHAGKDADFYPILWEA